jgi:predicted Zn-dependent peptidase
MLDRSVAPFSSGIQRPTLPQIEIFQLSNGIPVHILNRGDQPIVLLEMIIPVGRFEEPKPGLAYFLFKMLTEGTKDFTSSQIAEQFDQYGSQLEIVPYQVVFIEFVFS